MITPCWKPGCLIAFTHTHGAVTDPTADALAAIGMVLEVHDAMQGMVREDGLPAEAVDPAHGFAAALADAGYVVVRAEDCDWAYVPMLGFFCKTHNQTSFTEPPRHALAAKETP